jgi:tryptophan-rich sensory protein
MSLRALIVSFLICFAAAALESVLAGGGVKQRFAELRQPPLSPSLAIWVVVGLLYYAMCFALMYRLLAGDFLSALARTAFALVVILMLANAAWNYVFFRRKNMRGSFLFFVGYGTLAVALAAVLLSIDGLAASLVLLYLCYLVYAAWWAYRLWQLNEPAVRETA